MTTCGCANPGLLKRSANKGEASQPPLFAILRQHHVTCPLGARARHNGDIQEVAAVGRQVEAGQCGVGTGMVNRRDRVRLAYGLACDAWRGCPVLSFPPLLHFHLQSGHVDLVSWRSRLWW